MCESNGTNLYTTNKQLEKLFLDISAKYTKALHGKNLHMMRGNFIQDMLQDTVLSIQHYQR